MKKILVPVCSFAFLAACGNSPKTNQTSATDCAVSEVVNKHNSKALPGYEGTYKGILPAADCPGIETTLTLNSNKTYILHSVYIDKDSSFDEKGTYTFEDNLLTLQESNGDIFYYRVEENKIRLLTDDKQEVKGSLADHYILNKEIDN